MPVDRGLHESNPQIGGGSHRENAKKKDEVSKAKK